MEPMFYIWSFEHNAWWRSNRKGYTTSLAQAGRYTLTEASDICKGANHGMSFGSQPEEAMVPINS